MTKNAPGRAHRKGLTVLEIADMFRDEDHAREWVENFRWPNGPYCPECGSFNVQSDIKHKTATHRCRDCPGRTFFSLRKGSIMEGSKLPYRVWAVGIYLFTTNIKGISSMRLHRELGIGQKAAWFMLHRLREAFAQAETNGKFQGPVEVDETYMGGKRSNMRLKKRKQLTGRGPVGKTAVVGARDRATKRVKAKVVQDTTRLAREFSSAMSQLLGSGVTLEDYSRLKGAALETSQLCLRAVLKPGVESLDDGACHIERHGRRYRRIDPTPRKMMTSAGKIAYSRPPYGSDAGRSEVPVDDLVRFAGGHFTELAAEQGIFILSDLPPRGSLSLYEKLRIEGPSLSSVQLLADTAGERWESCKETAAV